MNEITMTETKFHTVIQYRSQHDFKNASFRIETKTGEITIYGRLKHNHGSESKFLRVIIK